MIQSTGTSPRLSHLICHNDCVRRALAISLLTLFLLPFALPLFGASARQTDLPACCRRNGKHHCMMSMVSSRMQTRIIGVKCPYRIVPPAVMVAPPYAPAPAASIFAGVTRHPAVAPQVEALRRVSLDRARQKRGPPAIFI